MTARGHLRKSGGSENNIVSLPFTRGPAGICQRWKLFINTTGLAIHISGVIVIVQYLQFIFSHDENSTIASPLPLAFYFGGCPEFNVDLAITKSLLCFDISTAGFDHHRIAFNSPGYFRFADTGPFRQVFAIE